MAKKIIVLLFMTACADMTIQKPDPQTYYKRDMDLWVNGIEHPGTLVARHNNKYELYVKFKGRGDLVLLKTCHREEEREDLGRSETIKFYPTQGIEDTGKCYLEVSAFSKKDGRHSWGLIDFEHPMWNLIASVSCNGKTYPSNGVTICQSKEGLIQEINFPEKVQVSKAARCYSEFSYEHVNGGKGIRFLMPKNECVFLITSDSGKRHKLTTVGYERVLLKEL